jgi:ABC-type dipeptide/oligopeptide/nickel transport system ATPase component
MVVSGLLEIEDLKVEFPSPHCLVKAVDGIASSVDPGGTVALVGARAGRWPMVRAVALLRA